MHKYRFILALAAVITVSCNKDSDGDEAAPVVVGTRTAVCNYPAGGTSPGPICGQISNATDDQLASFDRFVCNAGEITGTYTADTTCPAANVIHTCEINIAPLAFKFTANFYAAHTVESGTEYCRQIQDRANGG